LRPLAGGCFLSLLQCPQLRLQVAAIRFKLHQQRRWPGAAGEAVLQVQQLLTLG
jgi:hypothetical protein